MKKLFLSLCLILLAVLPASSVPLPLLSGGAGGGASSNNTLDPVNHGTPITISGGNLTATTSGANFGLARSILTESTGKYCYEVTTTAINSGDAVGIANSSTALTGFYLAEDANSLAVYQTGGVYINATLIGTANTFTNGSVVDVCLDFGNNAIWVRIDGGNWNNSGTANPATNTGGFSTSTLAAGPYYAAASFAFTASDNFIYNFTSSPTYSYPSGFTNWGSV